MRILVKFNFKTFFILKLKRSAILSLFIFILVLSQTFSASAQNSNIGINLKNSDIWQETQNLATVLKGYEIENSYPDKDWWCKFNDPILTSYIEEATRENRDIKTALARIEEARAYARYVMSDELPQLSAYPLYFRLSNPTTTPTGGIPIPTATSGGGTNVFVVPLIARYQLDLFKKNRYRTLSAEQEAKAVYFEYLTALISITTEVATNYFNLIRTDKLLELNEELLCYLQQALQIRNYLYKEGEISYDDILINQQSISRTIASIEELQKTQGLLVHQLCILMGKPPVEQSYLPRCNFDGIFYTDKIRIGSPYSFISRRPDILAAELRLSEAGINVSVARKDFFPSINIFGTFGFESIPLSSFFNLRGILAGVGAVPTISLFTGGSKFANLKVNKARCKEALQQYQKTALNAFKDVEDSIRSFNSDFVDYNESKKQVSEGQCLLCLTNTRFNEGENSLIDVINLQQQLITSKQNEVQAKANLFIDNISIYRALGGGF